MVITTGATFLLSTPLILDLLADKLGSDYQTSKAFGKAPNYVAAMRGRGGVLPDEIGLKAAEILDIPAEFVILSLAAERAMKGEHFEQLRELADKLSPPEFRLSEQKTLDL